MGDLNYNLLDDDDNKVHTCVDTFFEFGLYPLINVPTRFCDSTATVLDHFWTNIVDKPLKSAVILDPVADHLPVYLNLGIEMKEQINVIEKRCFSEKNISSFNNHLLKDMYTHDILQHRSTNAAYN